MNKIALGGIWLDDCRIPYEKNIDKRNWHTERENPPENSGWGFRGNDAPEMNNNGRFPANLLVSDDILNDGTITKQATRKYGKDTTGFNGFSQKNDIKLNKDIIVEGDSGTYSRYFDLDKWFETHE